MVAPSINIHGSLYSFSSPKVMGIINCTPDSFYSGSRTSGAGEALNRAGEMVAAGADILDIGAYSTRPGASEITPQEELDRLSPALEAIKSEYPDIPVSVDTFRAEVAARCIDKFGVEIINDVAGGTLDPEMFPAVAERKAAYILMHMRGNPGTMQSLTDYDDIVSDIISDLARKADSLRALGLADIIIDPGFGFAKTIRQNYQLLASLSRFKTLGMPILAGMSRKSMIWRPLGISPEESLPGTITLHTAAMLAGADIIRVHDVAQGVQSAKIASMILAETHNHTFNL